jgi:hypothetical protein
MMVRGGRVGFTVEHPAQTISFVKQPVSSGKLSRSMCSRDSACRSGLQRDR